MHLAENYERIRTAIVKRLENELAADLYYHSVSHAIDVEQQAARIAREENIVFAEDLFLLKVASLYHDTGFLFTYNHHEEAGCELVVKELPAFGLDASQVETVCGLIMATRIPQTPLSKLQEIICDADLDYLGRRDFFEISNHLFLELQARGYIVSENDWNMVQKKFFLEHKYFTDTDRKIREPLKQEHLEAIIGMIKQGV